jgi:hypothetical protein
MKVEGKKKVVFKLIDLSLDLIDSINKHNEHMNNIISDLLSLIPTPTVADYGGEIPIAATEMVSVDIGLKNDFEFYPTNCLHIH